MTNIQKEGKRERERERENVKNYQSIALQKKFKVFLSGQA